MVEVDMSLPLIETTMPLIDGLGWFTVFASREAADSVAEKARAIYAEDGLDFVVFERSDGKWLVTALDVECGVSWHIPAEMAESNGGPIHLRIL